MEKKNEATCTNCGHTQGLMTWEDRVVCEECKKVIKRNTNETVSKR